ncbi:MAG: hypothetical protein E7201_00665 [Selenomonas ruminantium]|uniref:Uncharacterized protein n=1 Tax=Selenomonas ruminantium TaxID=971 RepID=A0A927WGZ2_SELRU|nr:hypothetical protein [Selenomonas ruminantium]
MKNWSTDKIIAVGLMAAFVVTVAAMDAIAFMQGDMSVEGIAKELAIGLFSYMSRGFTTPTQTVQSQQSKVGHALGQAADVAREGSKIADAVENLKGTLKK